MRLAQNKAHLDAPLAHPLTKLNLYLESLAYVQEIYGGGGGGGGCDGNASEDDGWRWCDN